MSIIALNPRKDNQLNTENLLGYLEFHSIPDLRIHKAELTQLWSKHGLSNDFLPSEIRACDAFRRATAAARQTVNLNWQGGNYTAKLMVRELKSDASEIVRLLVREVVDTRNEVLDYAVVGKMIFNRGQELMRIQCESGFFLEYEYRKVLEQAATTFDEYINFHTRDTVRNIVNKVIRSTNPVRIIPRSQGKFVPKRSHCTLVGLQGLLQDLSTYANSSECCLDMIPIVNTAEQRQLVARRVNAELGSELEELVVELASQLKSDNSVTIESAQRMANKAQNIQQRAAEYEKMLNLRLSVLRTQLSEFINRTSIATESNSTKQDIAG